MMNDLHTPQISLFSEQEEPQSYEIYVYGTDDLVEQHKDSFCLALCRYLYYPLLQIGYKNDIM